MRRKWKIVDLSMPISGDMPVYAGLPTSRVSVTRWHERDGVFCSLIELSTHAGTHVDAPFHQVNDKLRLHELPLHSFVGDALCLAVKPKKELEHITVKDLEKAEERAETELQEQDIAIIYSGWAEKYLQKTFFDAHPGLTVDAAKWLIQRGVKTLGCDLPSVDRPEKGEGISIHHTLFKSNIPIIENLINLQSIAGKRFFFVGLPLKLHTAPDGSPIRAVAFFE